MESFDVKVIYMMLKINDMLIIFNHELYVNSIITSGSIISSTCF